MDLRASFILVFLPLLRSQKSERVFFPTEDGETSALPSGADLMELRGTSLYERYIEQIISSGNTKLSLAVSKVLLEERGNDSSNVIIAPMSITVALALILLGAKGETFTEVSNVMGLPAGVDIQGKSLVVHEYLNKVLKKITDSAGIDLDQQLSLASGIFVQNDYPIRKLYKDTAEQVYHSEVLNVDFKTDPSKAMQIMNSWVSERTKEKIHSILTQPPPDTTRVIIASALYFKALWAHPFSAGVTLRKPFYVNGRRTPTSIQVDMMANAGTFPYYKDLNLRCEILGLPYKGNATTMYIILPFDSSKERLKQFEGSLTQADVDRLADNTRDTRIIMTFPMMKIESTTNLKNILKKLGVNSLFNPSEANLALLSPGHEVADCTNIFNASSDAKMCETNIGSKKVIYRKFGEKVGRRIAKRDAIDAVKKLVSEQSSENINNPGLYADEVIHKVYMDITETGTEAAASTFVVITKTGFGKSFRVDMPFLFFIRHEATKTVLFWGSVIEPTPSFKKN